MSTPDLPRAPDLPSWMAKLRDRYLHTETSLFVLHDNVHDSVICADQVWSMPRFVDAFFEPSDKVVVHYDPGRGLWFANDKHAGRAGRSLVGSGFINPTKFGSRGIAGASDAAIARRLELEFLGERQPAICLNVIEQLLVNDDVSVAAVIHYAEMVAPNGAVSSLGFYERTAAARLHRWSVWEEVAGSDNLVLMLTSSFTELARQITRNPRVGAIHVPLPNALERARFLATVEPGMDPDRGEALTRITAGLQLRQIKDLLSANAAPTPDKGKAGTAREMFRGQGSLPVDAIFHRKKEILEQECAGLIEVIEPGHGFEVVGGMDHVKNALMKVAGHVKAGRSRQVPMGILFVGPMGTGKTFLAEAFAKESGLAAIKLKNFRDKWVGSTEANLEKVLNVIEGLGEILVMIDEGDRSIGGAGDSDGGVNSRVMARLKEFMSDTSHRGRVIFVMMTNRPDKLDTDIKRPGRFDLKIPFFPPQNSEERAAILRAIMRRHKLDNELPDETLLPLLEPLDGYGAADLEAVALMAFDDVQSGYLPKGAKKAADKITPAYLAQAIHDFMPTRETAMIHYMELLAVQEASNRRMLPPRYAELSIAEINERLADARSKLPGAARA